MADAKDPLPPDVREALQRGDALDAIRLLRKRAGFGNDATRTIERATPRIDAAASGLSPGEVPRSAGLGRWLMVAAIVLAVVYAVFSASPGG